jgi:hypothetical protein
MVSFAVPFQKVAETVGSGPDELYPAPGCTYCQPMQTATKAMERIGLRIEAPFWNKGGRGSPILGRTAKAFFLLPSVSEQGVAERLAEALDELPAQVWLPVDEPAARDVAVELRASLLGDELAVRDGARVLRASLLGVALLADVPLVADELPVLAVPLGWAERVGLPDERPVPGGFPVSHEARVRLGEPLPDVTAAPAGFQELARLVARGARFAGPAWAFPPAWAPFAWRWRGDVPPELCTVLRWGGKLPALPGAHPPWQTAHDWWKPPAHAEPERLLAPSAHRAPLPVPAPWDAHRYHRAHRCN